MTSKILEKLKRDHQVEDIFKKKKDQIDELDMDLNFTDYDDTIEMKKISRKRKKSPTLNLDAKPKRYKEERYVGARNSEKLQVR